MNRVGLNGCRLPVAAVVAALGCGAMAGCFTQPTSTQTVAGGASLKAADVVDAAVDAAAGRLPGCTPVA